MSNSYDYRVTPMKWSKLDGIADGIRALLKLSDDPYFPIVEVVEKALPILLGPEDGFCFQVGTENEMGSAEGLTCPKGTFIRIREDVYKDACIGGKRARFTFAHEFGHFVLHTGQNQPFARANPNETLRAFESAEKQADRFAATLLMPTKHISFHDRVVSLMERFGVSKMAATVRLEKMVKKGLL